MAHLRIFDLHDTLTSTPPSTCPSGTYTATFTELLEDDENIQVFRSDITAAEDASFQFRAVCKIGYGSSTQRITREAGLYQQQLKDLQGRYIPRVLGLFVGTTSRGPTAVLVMSDEGRELKTAMRYLPLQFRKRVFRGLRRIHQAGVSHNDICEANVVVRRRKDGSYWPMIVDFDNSTKHECVSREKVQIYGPYPMAPTDLCYELTFVGCPCFTDIWRPRTCTFANSWIPAEDATDVDSVLAAAAHIIADRNMSEEQSRLAAERTVEQHLRWYDERMKWDRSPDPVEGCV